MHEKCNRKKCGNDLSTKNFLVKYVVDENKKITNSDIFR